MSPDAYTEIAEVENKHWWFLARRKVLEGVIGGLGLPERANILEIGSGTGGNLPMLSRFGTVRGIEMDDFARKFAIDQTQGAIDIRYGKCPGEIPFEDMRFDLICMFDVLEHVQEDVETISIIKERLTPGGILLITVPAYKWMWSGHDEFLHHVRRYSRGELGSKLANAGFSTRKLTHFNTLLFPLIALARLKDRLVSRKMANVNALPPPLINSVLKTVFAAEAKLVRAANLSFGVSLLAIAENTSVARRKAA